MGKISKLQIDSTGAITDLCYYGTKYPTDKSPYSSTWHRHPYTAVYNFLFSTLRYSPIVFGEIGILDNMSMHMWRSFFTEAQLYGFEYFDDKIERAISECIPGATYSSMNIADKVSIFTALNNCKTKFDILIDDSTHLFEHQINFVEVALDFVKPGGMLVIEDVFRHWPNERYEEAIGPYFDYFSSVVAVETNHENAYSGGNHQEPYYDNDKLIVLYRNRKQRVTNSAAGNIILGAPLDDYRPG